MAETYHIDPEHLSHAYIVSSASREAGLRAATGIAAAALCSGKVKPCGTCRACRKVMNGTHPDVVYIERENDDKGKLRKEIRVNQIREMILDAQVVPNEADRKVYIIKEADLMNPQAQNAALKLLEEPPGGVVFVLLVSNEELLLPTVRSRCVALTARADDAPADDEEAVKQASKFLKAVGQDDRLQLLRWSVAAENMDNQQALQFMRALKEMCTDMLCGRSGSGKLTQRQLVQIVELTDTCTAYLKVNAGVKHVFGMMTVKAPTQSRNRG